MKRTLCALIVLGAVLGTSITLARASDWPHWLGPVSNGSSPETGLLTKWPSAGPKTLWETAGGDGYSSLAIADGKAITLVQREAGEIVLALDAVKGTELWKTPIGPAFRNQYGNGPRSTPWIDGDHVYVQSVSGPLVCLDAKSGAILWQKHLLNDFGGKNITWGLSASPVIADNLVLAIPGGKDAGVAAFDKLTGKLAWKVGNDKAAYASPVVATVAGAKQAIFFNAAGLLGVSLSKGEELWRHAWKTDFDCNIMTPIVVDGDKLFVSSGESNGCVLFQLNAAAAPKTVWESKGRKSVMINYWANPVIHEGFLYGFAGEFSNKIHLRCIDLKTGKPRWTQEDFGKGSMTLADGHLFITTKEGDLVLVRATPEAYDEKARIPTLGNNRTAPTLANKRLYLRDLKTIKCLDVGAGS
ncbi:MAG: PQQ-binding-like beta-propeller repeat protein [Planctomycetota bacterium]